MLKYKSILMMTVLLGFILSVNSDSRALTIYVKKAPPARKVIVVKTPAPYANGIWIQGRWKWNGNKYVWVNGYWVKPRYGHVWVPGHWVKTRRGWHWRSGHWKRI